MIDEAAVGCYNESEQAMGLFTHDRRAPFVAVSDQILGARVTVRRFGITTQAKSSLSAHEGESVRTFR
jgi:hypothetical protein